MKTRPFGCMEMKRRVSARIHEQIKNLTFQQKTEYWRRRSEEFRREQDEILRRDSSSGRD